MQVHISPPRQGSRGASAIPLGQLMRRRCRMCLRTPSLAGVACLQEGGHAHVGRAGFEPPFTLSFEAHLARIAHLFQRRFFESREPGAYLFSFFRRSAACCLNSRSSGAHSGLTGPSITFCSSAIASVLRFSSNRVSARKKRDALLF